MLPAAMNAAAAPQGSRRLRGGAALPIALTVGFGALVVAAFLMKALGTGLIADDAAFTLSLACSQTIGLVLVLRRPANRVGWIVCVIAWASSVQAFIAAYTQLAVQRQWPITVMAWIDGKTFLWLWAGVMALFLYFPTGALPSPRWRVPARLAAGAVVLGFLVFAFAPGPLFEEPLPGGANPPNPTALPEDLWRSIAFIEGIAFVALIAALMMSVASLVVRYRAASGEQRLQIRWVMSAAVAFGVVMLASVALRHLRPELVDALDVVAGLAFTLIPVSIGVAILRFRLYEIDRIVSRTFVYLVLTAVLGGAYALAVTVARAVTEPVTGDAAVAVAASTLLVAALFQPLRRRIQIAVDRRFNRARYDAVATVQSFSARLRDEVDLDTLGAELLGVVRTTMQPMATTLWLRETPR